MASSQQIRKEHVATSPTSSVTIVWLLSAAAVSDLRARGGTEGGGWTVREPWVGGRRTSPVYSFRVEKNAQARAAESKPFVGFVVPPAAQVDVLPDSTRASRPSHEWQP